MIGLKMIDREQSTRVSSKCHYVTIFVIAMSYMSIYVTCNAEAEPGPVADANPNALWDKLPALQEFHAAGKLLSMKPKQSLTSSSQGMINTLMLVRYNKLGENNRFSKISFF